MTLMEAFVPRDGEQFPRHESEARAPVYNAEDYTGYMRKHCKLTNIHMYIHPDTGKKKCGKGKQEKSENKNSLLNKNDTNVMEMGLKQFSSVSELLSKLKADLHLSFSSFIKEFIGQPNDGVSLLLDLLKVIQLSQTNISGVKGAEEEEGRSLGVFKRALADEHETLVCLKLVSASEDGGRRLLDHPSGLFTVAVCVMSNFSKSRVLALQLLTRTCELTDGHTQVSDALSMLRLRFGEPVRFKFLIGMLNSQNSGAFQIACLRFLNTYIESADGARERIHIQSELEQAGLDIQQLHKLLSQVGSKSELLKDELSRWQQNYIDVNHLVLSKLELESKVQKLETELSKLREKNLELETRNLELAKFGSRRKVRSTEPIEPRWVEGKEREGWREESDHDSGKHSDNSLSQSDNWSIRKESPPRQEQGGDREKGDAEAETMADWKQDEKAEGSKNELEEKGIREVNLTPGSGLQMFTDTDSDKSSYSEKQEKEDNREIGSNKKRIEIEGEPVTVTIIEDIYTAERNVSQEETELVENETITIDSFCKKYGLQDVLNDNSEPTKLYSLVQKSSSVVKKQDTEQSEVTNFFKSEDKLISESTTIATSDEEMDLPSMRRTPRPPVRRRTRCAPAEPRPKSTPISRVEYKNILNKRSSADAIKDKSEFSPDFKKDTEKERKEKRNGENKIDNNAEDKENSREGGDRGERRERGGRIERSKSSAVSRSLPAKPDRNGVRSKNIIQDFSSREPSVSSYRESTSREHSVRELGISRESSVRDSREPSVISYLDFSRESSLTSRKDSQGQINRRDFNGSRDSSINQSRVFNGSRDSSINQSRDFNGSRDSNINLSRDLNGSRDSNINQSRDFNGSKEYSINKSSINNARDCNSSFSDWNTRQIEHGYRDISSRKQRPVNSRVVSNGQRGGRSRVDSFRDELFEYMDEGRLLDDSRDYLQSAGSNFNTLETVSARSFGYVRPDGKVEESKKRVKRHKSFFNSESLKSKKNSMLRRAESLHQGLEGGYRFKNVISSRAKSVDRLEDQDESLTSSLKKSKSMEFLKSKILRRPSKVQGKSPLGPVRLKSPLPSKHLGRSLSELRYTSSPPPAPPGSSSNSGKILLHPGRHYPEYHYQPSPSELRISRSKEMRQKRERLEREGRMEAEMREGTREGRREAWLGSEEKGMREGMQSRHDESERGNRNKRVMRDERFEREDRNLKTDKYKEHRRSAQDLHDWREDTPFWKGRRPGGKKENALSWGIQDSGPPNWIPPSPGQSDWGPISPGWAGRSPGPPEWVPPPPHMIAPNSKIIKDVKNNWSKAGKAGFPLNQAVNAMYLPEVNPADLPDMYSLKPADLPDMYSLNPMRDSYISIQEYREHSVEITELDDLPLDPSFIHPTLLSSHKLNSNSSHPSHTVHSHPPIQDEIPLRPNLRDVPGGLY